MMYQQYPAHPAPPAPNQQRGDRGRTALIVAFVLNTIGGIAANIGLSTSYLVTGSDSYTHAGYYSSCIPFFGCSATLNDNSLDWLVGGAAVNGVGYLFAVISWILLLIWLCLSSKTKCMKYSILILVNLTWICYASSLIIWIVEYDAVFSETLYDVGWGFYVGWVGVAFLMVSVFAVFLVPIDEYPRAGYVRQHVAAQPPMPVARPQVVRPGFYPAPAPVQQAAPLPMKPVYPQSQISTVSYPGYAQPAYVPAGYGYNTGLAAYPAYR